MVTEILSSQSAVILTESLSHWQSKKKKCNVLMFTYCHLAKLFLQRLAMHSQSSPYDCIEPKDQLEVQVYAPLSSLKYVSSCGLSSLSIQHCAFPGVHDSPLKLLFPFIFLLCLLILRLLICSAVCHIYFLLLQAASCSVCI